MPATTVKTFTVEELTELLRDCHSVLGDAVCSIPESDPVCASARSLMERICPVINPEVHAAFAMHKERVTFGGLFFRCHRIKK